MQNIIEIVCKRCGSNHYVNNGIVRNKQRYKCKDCGCNFIAGDNRGKIKIEAKALSLLMYGSGKASYGMIAKLFNVTRPAVYHWIKTFSKLLPEPIVNTDVKEVQIDEMWHFINKKNKKYGYSEPWTVLEIKPSNDLLAIVMLKRSANSLKN
jgi:transposase